MEQPLLQIDLIPSQRDEFTYAKSVTIRDQDQRRVAVTVATDAASGV
jgi:hypothetical protein